MQMTKIKRMSNRKKCGLQEAEYRGKHAEPLASAYLHVHVCACARACVHACVHVHMCVRVHACVYACAHVCGVGSMQSSLNN